MNKNREDFSRPHISRIAASEANASEAREDGGANATIYPINYLGIIRIAGADAGTFLQGQMTYDIFRISRQSSSLCAFCNAKGRVFATARIVEADDDFLLLVSLDLLDPLIKRLRMYVLRSDAVLENVSGEYDLIGTGGPIPPEATRSMALQLPDTENGVSAEKDLIAVKTGSNNRYLLIAKNQTGERIRSAFMGSACAMGKSGDWYILDILDGIPAITSKTSEEFVPQMLNLDRLNAISFDKGCYTGQEIVARSHYLGQLKRRMYLAQANLTQPPAAATQLVDCSNLQQQNAGKVVNAAPHTDGNCYLLVVLKIDSAERDDIRIQNCDGDPITLLELPYSFD